MDEYLDGLMKVIEKSRNLNKSKASNAPVITTPCNYVVSNNPNRIISKAASLPKEPTKIPIVEGIEHYTFNKVKEIHDFMSSNGNAMGLSSLNGPAGWKEEQQSNGSVVYSNPNSKAASVSINKAKEIYDFITSNGRL